MSPDRSTLISRLNKAEGRVVDLSAQLRAVTTRIGLSRNLSLTDALKAKRAGIERDLVKAKQSLANRKDQLGRLDAQTNQEAV